MRVATSSRSSSSRVGSAATSRRQSRRTRRLSGWVRRRATMTAVSVPAATRCGTSPKRSRSIRASRDVPIRTASYPSSTSWRMPAAGSSATTILWATGTGICVPTIRRRRPLRARRAAWTGARRGTTRSMVTRGASSGFSAGPTRAMRTAISVASRLWLLLPTDTSSRRGCGGTSPSTTSTSHGGSTRMSVRVAFRYDPSGFTRPRQPTMIRPAAISRAVQRMP